MTSTTGNGDNRGNGRFACAAPDEQSSGGVACPCCGGSLSLATLESLLEQARAHDGGTPDRSGMSLRAGAMIIDPHAHMISRTTADYEAMARAGVVAVIEPAFWLGQPRTSVETYIDYLSMITGFERFRAGQFGIRHYCTVGLNPKEANNEALAEAVMAILPRFALKDGVVAMGELGYDEQTALEDKYLRAQIELAKDTDLPIMIHTPHRDKKRGTLRTMDVLAEHGFDPGRCVIDHNNEETVADVLDRGYWVAFSIYPNTKMGNERMTEIVRRYGPDRLIVDSACDWGVSDPLAVPKTALLMAQRGIEPDAIRKVTYANALAVYGLSGQMREQDWLDPAPVDQRTIYEGNSVLRGGQAPRIDTPRRASDDLRIS
jgi:predicted metal-dependent TIM-barrel fold hydrolase